MHKAHPISCSNFPAEFSTLKWDMLQPDKDGVVYWHIANFPSSMDKVKVISAFEHCFYKWQEAMDNIQPIGRAISFLSTEDFDKAHIRLFFLPPRQRRIELTLDSGKDIVITSNWPFDGPLGKLGYRLPSSHDLYFDDSENWSDAHESEVVDVGDVPKSVHLFQVALHEFGHVLDLGHSDQEGAVMYPTYVGAATAIHPDDIAGLQKVWGKMKEKFKAIIPASMETAVKKPDIVYMKDKLPWKKLYKKRPITAIQQYVVHHAAGNMTVEQIHKLHQDKGWPGIGYTYVIYKDGTIYKTNDHTDICYNVGGQNTKTLGICLVGNFEKEIPQTPQTDALWTLLAYLKSTIGDKPIVGHRDRTNTLCPGEHLYKLIANYDNT